MEKRVQKALQQAEFLKKQSDSIPWKLDEPWTQYHHAQDTEGETWQPSRGAYTSTQAHLTDVTGLALHSWNIDFMLPFSESWMGAALADLNKLLSQLPSVATTATVINFQECIPGGLITISQQEWVRERFYMTDLGASTWASEA
ncbi:hypothetical protein ONZ43_g7696 [Nemania bipapillata]|uniref:Uncharacterized protein n=1 Tax=Nemania bipapillata TaxID=110536 RepID=A0ACC2HP78_9PEZI|nr:hypothetical protein ONZ43_g7696 [Nemania bipapillata]